VKSRSKKIKRDVIAAMREADMPPQLIYAYERTGFLLLEEGYKNLSPEEKAEYDAAIEEYHAKELAKAVAKR
jgi:ABC-type transporter MlaC component